MKKNKKCIKIFALTLFFMICLSVNANVKAETNYFDDNGVMYRLIFDDTQLKDFVKRDFALYYNEKDLQNEDIAKLTATSKSGTYTYSNGFAKNKDLKIIIFETSESWQQNNNQKYIVYVLPDYVSGNYNSVDTRINDNVIVKRGDTYKYYWFSGDRYYKDREFGLDNLNFNKNDSNVKMQSGIQLNGINGDTELLIIVNKDGTIKRWNDLIEYNENLWEEIIQKARYNLIYSNLDVYNEQGTEIIRPKEDFETRNITYTYEKVKNNELYDIEFSVKGLKKGDKIFLGNYDSDNEKYLQQFNIISNTENPNARFVFNDISKNARIDILIKDEKDNILISESVNIDIDIFEDLKNGNINDFFTYVNNFINNKINKPIKNIMNSFQLLFNRLDVDLQIGIVIIFLIMIIFGIFKFLMKG